MSRKQEQAIVLGTVEGAAGTNDTKKFIPVPTGGRRMRIKRLDFMPDDAVTADNTDYSTYALANTTESTTLHSRATTVAGGALVSGTPINVDLSAIAADKLIIDPGDVFTASKTDAGSGKAGSGKWIAYCEEWN